MLSGDGRRPVLQAPRDDGQVVASPPARELKQLVAKNRAAFDRCDVRVGGRTLSSLRASARRTILDRALRHTRRYRSAPAPDAGNPVVMGGHQPELFHPGVWYKNFALGQLADLVLGTAVNLVIDTDLVRSPGIKVPSGSLQRPRVDMIPIDDYAADVAYEERSIADPGRFGEFGGEVSRRMRDFGVSPCIESWWPSAKERARATGNLGAAIAESRHLLEETFANETLEIPLSAASSCEAYWWFVAHILATARSFRSTHNRALTEYRNSHRIRNLAHPMPDLAIDEPWVEAPFWIWQRADPHRRSLYVRSTADGLELSDHDGWRAFIASSNEDDLGSAVTALGELAAEGIKIRTRAVTTTLFARLLLCDVFLHGIGGSKYDEVTDAIIANYFELPTPQFATVSATLRLPLPVPAGGGVRLREAGQHLRKIEYHPETYLTAGSGGEAEEAEIWVASKRQWVAIEKTPANAAIRHRGITSANAALQPFVANARTHWEQQRHTAKQDLAAEKLLGSREFSFCLYPAEKLRKLMSRPWP